MMDRSLVILCTAIGLIFGIIGGALWLVIKLILSQKKALKEFKEGKIIKTKNSPQEKLRDTPTQQSRSGTHSEEGKVSKENKTAIEDTNKSALSKLEKKNKEVKNDRK